MSLVASFWKSFISIADVLSVRDLLKTTLSMLLQQEKGMYMYCTWCTVCELKIPIQLFSFHYILIPIPHSHSINL